MPRKPQDVTDAELAILHVLWDEHAATARAMAERLYGDVTESNLATVQKLLQRLETKRCIKRNRKTWPHVFTPALERDELIGRRLRSTAEELCAGSFSPLLTHLVKSRQLSPEDRQALRDLLEQLEREDRTRE
jgi:BlaI family transcriptional regulator, penicillinase repressor